MIKVSDYIFKFVEELGVKDVFYLPGGGCMHLVDSLGKNKNLSNYVNLNEQCSAIAASGYSKYKDSIGVALVTTGPGGTNAITGVASAWIDSVPILVLSGQVKRSDSMTDKHVRQMGPQEVDIISMVSSITKFAKTVDEPNMIKYYLQEAVFWAREGRKGPVWLDIPLDIQGAYIEEEELISFNAPEDKKYSINDMDRIIEMINKSERPVILAGYGIYSAKAKESFKTLINKLNIPIQTTWRAIDLIEEEHPLYFGRPGAIASRYSNFIIQNSDLLITIGARLDSGQIAFSFENLARGAKKIIIDIDQNELNKVNTDIDVLINASAKIFIDELLKHIDKVQIKNRSSWFDRCQKWVKRYPVVMESYYDIKDGVDTYVLVESISTVLQEGAILVPGSSGTCSEITSQAFKVKKNQRFINSPGLGSMGFGVAESIGVCIASEKQDVVCITGDGGLQHNLQEIQLLRTYKLPIKLIVLNNNAYASIRLMQERIFNGNLVGCDSSSGVELPDLGKISTAYGIPFERIENHKQLNEKLESVINAEGPIICEVIVQPNQVIKPRVSSMVKEDGTIVSKPLEDLWPFLEREEFNSNMIIEPLKE